MYSELVMEHFRNPRNMGVIEDADGVGEVGNPQCGDMMRITIKVKDDTLEDVKFQTLGCGAAVATSSMVTEMAKGKKLDEALGHHPTRPWPRPWAGCRRPRCTAPTWLPTVCRPPSRTTGPGRRPS